MHAKKAAVLAGSRFDADPRHIYWSESLVKAGFDVVEIEVTNSPTNWRHISEVQVRGNRVSVFGSQRGHVSSGDTAKRLRQVQPETTTGQFIFQSINHVVRSVSLVQKVIHEVDLLILNDLPALVAYTSLTQSSKPFTIYDAQEVFVDSYDLLNIQKLSTGERDKWIEIETFGIQKVDKVVTVSTGIANLYRERHGCEASVVPNFVPCDRFLRVIDQKSITDPVRFVFVGRADPYRGLEELVDQWNLNPERATLDLIIPVSSYQRKLLRRLESKKRGNQDVGIHFRTAVPPERIIPTLLEYDVGIIPYNYPYPYSYCSPNKLGEYIAANLPVISNSQPYLKEIIEISGIGACFDWGNEASFRQCVLEVSDPTILKQLRNTVEQMRIPFLSWDTYLVKSNVLSLIKNIECAANAKSNVSALKSAVEIDKVFPRAILRHVMQLSIVLLRANARVVEPLLRYLIRTPLIRRIIRKVL